MHACSPILADVRGAGGPGPELAQELIDHVHDRIAHYETPRSVDFSVEVPRTPTGTLLERLIRMPCLAS